MTKAKRYTVTSALPYANGPLHIGHIAGAYLPADIYVRYLRLKGEDVAFICGSDEHGVAITLKAMKEKTTPKEIIDKYHNLNKESFKKFGIDFDIYHRTSEPLHHKTAQAFFLRLHEKDKFDEEESEQFFDEENQLFLADRYIIGTCPKCGYENAFGDQCEKCGSSLSPSELVNPRSALSGKPPVLKTTKHWYLPMNEYEDWLKDWILKGHTEWKKNVYGQCKSWLEQKLQPRAMTRDLDWGVPVPLPDSQGKVLYVWLDAPIGYISATKAWAEEKGIDWEPWWKDEETRLIHFIGKDNIVFHCIIFPILLKAHGDFILPDNVPANEFMNMEGDKISTSRNWAVWLHEYLEEFPDKQDVLRYVLCSIMPETKDSEFTWKDFQARNNNELANILGNFVKRVLDLTKKYFDGVVPEVSGEIFENFQDSHPGKYDVFKHSADYIGLVVSDTIDPGRAKGIEGFRFKEALNELMNLARAGNQYLTDEEPWKKINSDIEEVKPSIFIGIQFVAKLSVLMEPFLPFASKKLKKMLNIEDVKFSWDETKENAIIKSGHLLNQPEMLFEKIEDDIIQKQIDKLHMNAEATAQNGNVKPNISFEEFSKQDLRVGKILEAQKVEKADKLLQLIVDLGFEKRTIVSGIAEFYKPEEVIGKQVSVVVNLAPRKIRGIESQGMILMAEDSGGRLSFVSIEHDTPAGSVIR